MGSLMSGEGPLYDYNPFMMGLKEPGLIKDKDEDDPYVSVPASRASSTAVEEAARRQAEALRKRKGKASTIVTGQEGLLNTPANTQPKTLLGQ